MGWLVLNHANLKQSCSKSRTVSSIYKRQLLGSIAMQQKIVSSTLQAAKHRLARLVFLGWGGRVTTSGVSPAEERFLLASMLEETAQKSVSFMYMHLQVHVRPSP
jgi:hypothetical protein